MARDDPLKVRSLVGLMPLLAVETLEPELLASSARIQAPAAAGSSPTARSWPAWSRAGRSRAMGERRLLALVRGRPHAAAARPHARPRRVPQPLRDSLASAATTSTTRTCSTVEGAAARVDYEPAESTQRALRRQLQLARSDLVPDQLPADRVAAKVPPLLRRRLHGRAPDRLGPASSRSSRSPTTSRDRLIALFLPRRPRADAPSSASAIFCRPTRTGATISSSTSTSTATPAPASAPATRPAGRRWWRSCWSRESEVGSRESEAGR